MQDLIERMVALGFSEYEAKAYLTLLRHNPVTGYQLAKHSGVPRSMIYEVLNKLVNRGAVIKLHRTDAVEYAPVPANILLEQIRREHETLVSSLKADLEALSTAPNLDYVWNIEGRDAIFAHAKEMINRAERRIYIALRPSTFFLLRQVLEAACQRGVHITLYTTDEVDLPGAQVVVTHVTEVTLEQARGLGLIIVIDGEEVLIAEWLSADQARASWTSTPLIVFIAEHHLRTDLYLPALITALGDRALEIIREEDRELFIHAMESFLKDI